jgi:hypothetical protein
MLPAPGVPETRARRNDLDEMTIRRTEVPASAAGRVGRMRRGPRKPSLDVMGPGTDRETPLPPGRNKPRSGLVSANDRSEKSRPHFQDAREAHDTEMVPLTPEDRPRPKPRSIGGRPGSDVGKRGRR